MAFGETEEGEVTTCQGCLRIGDDGPQPGDAPARSHEGRRRRVLPALELGDAERDEMRVEEGTTALQHGEQATVHLRQSALERRPRFARPRGPPSQCQGLPADLVKVALAPSALEGERVGAREQPLEGVGEAAETANRVHRNQKDHPRRSGKPGGNPVENLWNTGDNVALPDCPA